MSDEERLKWLKEIEKDIFVCSLESTFVEDAKSCAIHSAIETLENRKTIIDEIEKIKEEIKDLDLGFVDEEYQAGIAYGIMKFNQILDKHIRENKQ